LDPDPRYSGRWIDGQHPAYPHGSDTGLAHGHDAQDGRRHPTPSDDVHANNLLIFLLQFCGGSGVVLHCPKSFQHLAVLSEQESTHAEARESCAGRKTKTMMTPKDLLDTMLGYLGFVVQIEETTNEGGNLTLQIYTEESRRLIGRDGETLEAIQFLLNRLLQAKDKDAEKVIVDCEHYRSMREDRIVQRVRELAERVRITGRSLQLEPMNSYERRLVHNAFKDDPDVATWSPSDSARIKQITLVKRQPKKEPAQKE
jgi:spoIIIJ-associated protein